MIGASSKLLSALFSGGPKIVIVRTEACNEDIRLPDLPVEWLAITAADGNVFRFSEDDEPACPVEMPPSNVLAVWVPHSHPSVDALKQWWERASGTSRGPVFVHGDATHLIGAVADQTLRENNRLTRMNQTLLEDLAALREGLAHHVRVPPELEVLLKNLRTAPPRLIFETPFFSSTASVTGAIIQPLLTGARGILGVDLHVSNAGLGAGHLLVKLQAPSSGLELAQWRIPYSETFPGWLALRLPAVSARMDSIVELSVEPHGDGQPPELTCSPAGLMNEYAFIGSDITGNMLRMRMWGGFPGLSYQSPSSDTSFSPALVKISDHLVAAAQTTRPLTWTYPYFNYLGAGRLLLRPLKVTPASSARISLPALPGLAALNCTVRIDDGLCTTKMLVRLAASVPGRNIDEVEDGTAVLAVTEWTELSEPLRIFDLRLALPSVISEPIELHLFSRLPEGGKLDHGKVVFGGFEATLNERAAFSHLPYLPQAVTENS